MSEIKFKYIGWCSEEGHDKVWTSFRVENTWYCAWGRRGKRLLFKNHGKASTYNPDYNQKLEKLRADKEKGKSDGSSRYKEVDSFLLFTVFPDFQEQVEKELFMATLGDKIK